MVARVIKLGFLGLDVLRFDEMKHHYAQVVGLTPTADTPSEAFFACGVDSMAICLRKAGAAGARSVGLVVAPDEDLAAVAARARAAGLAAEVKSDLFGSIPACVEIADPDGNTIFLYPDAAPAGMSNSGPGVQPLKLGHTAFFVKDARESARFYTEALGFRWSDWLEDFFVFMRCNADHHAMNFLTSDRRGLYHVAFELKDFAHLGRSCDILAEHGQRILWGPGRHGMGHNIFNYHRDPDGNIIEFFTELDRMSDESLGYFDPRPYHTDFPQRPKVWQRGDPMTINSWGAGTPPEMR